MRIQSIVVLALSATVVACGGTDTSGGSSGGTGNSCDSSNCNGCCANGVCQPGSASDACGVSGAACQACAGYQACMSGACGIDPKQVWVVVPTSATIADTNNGSSWDGDGSAPDPYVVMDGHKTAAVQDTYTPMWTTGWEAPASTWMGPDNTIQLFDEDVVSDDPITPASMFQLSEQDLATGSKSFANWGGVVSINFSITKKQ